MPLYEYLCEACGQRTEMLQRLGEAPLTSCPKCGGTLRKLPSAPAFQFKGTGWYLTDYARKSGGGGGATKSAEGDGASDKASSAGASEAKPAAAEAPSKPKPSGD